MRDIILKFDPVIYAYILQNDSLYENFESIFIENDYKMIFLSEKSSSILLFGDEAELDKLIENLEKFYYEIKIFSILITNLNNNLEDYIRQSRSIYYFIEKNDDFSSQYSNFIVIGKKEDIDIMLQNLTTDNQGVKIFETPIQRIAYSTCLNQDELFSDSEEMFEEYDEEDENGEDPVENSNNERTKLHIIHRPKGNYFNFRDYRMVKREEDFETKFEKEIDAKQYSENKVSIWLESSSSSSFSTSEQKENSPGEALTSEKDTNNYVIQTVLSSRNEQLFIQHLENLNKIEGDILIIPIYEGTDSESITKYEETFRQYIDPLDKEEINAIANKENGSYKVVHLKESIKTACCVIYIKLPSSRNDVNEDLIFKAFNYIIDEIYISQYDSLNTPILVSEDFTLMITSLFFQSNLTVTIFIEDPVVFDNMKCYYKVKSSTSILDKELEEVSINNLLRNPLRDNLLSNLDRFR